MSDSTRADAPNKPSGIKKIIKLAVVLALVGFVAFGLYKSKQSSHLSEVTLQGQMFLQQSAIAAKVPGRVVKILVKEGGQVEAGSPLIEMDSPEISAKLQQANAAKKMAQSQLDKAKKGARPQELAQAKSAWHANQTQANLAKTTFARVNTLYKEGLISRQKRDEAQAKYIALRDKANVAKEQYALAKEGARAEDIAAATAQVQRVDGLLKEAQVAQSEANLSSPISGVVDTIIVNPGEVVGQGVPLLTLVDSSDQWVVLNVKENLLSHFGIGQSFTATIPALSTKDKPYEQTFTVFASSVMSDFATWRATSDEDGFDIRTFAIKARPASIDPAVRAGMSVLVTLDK